MSTFAGPGDLVFVPVLTTATTCIEVTEREYRLLQRQAARTGTALETLARERFADLLPAEERTRP